VPTVIEPGGNVDLNTRGHRKTQAQTRHAVAVEGPREVDYKPKPRKAHEILHLLTGFAKLFACQARCFYIEAHYHH
jgi:hypothetical protein